MKNEGQSSEQKAAEPDTDFKKLHLHGLVSRELKIKQVDPPIRAFLLHVMRRYERDTPLEVVEKDAKNYGILLKSAE